ncbi:hypothetical protein [Streptomyces sp. NBC_01622]|uniref:hypothetical protein n=1 Tax=Streptomyces sp. NBC_01622 TaxID=2975903 RepID=UPI0038641B8F
MTLCTPAPEVRMNHGFFTLTRERGLNAVGEADTWSHPGVRAGPLAHHASAGAEFPICTAILRNGYRMGERLLRSAVVKVPGPPL